MTVAPPYTGPTGPAPGIGAWPAVARYAYAYGLWTPDDVDVDAANVEAFGAFLVGIARPPARPVTITLPADLVRALIASLDEYDSSHGRPVEHRLDALRYELGIDQP